MNLVFWIVLLTYSSLAIELIVFPVPSVVSTAQLAHEGSSGRLARWGHGLRGLIVGTFLGLPILLVMFPNLARMTYPLVDPVPMASTLAGVALIVVGRCLSMGAALSMRRGLKPFRGSEPPTLLTAGFFRFSRNPILLGMLLMYAGLIAVLPHAIMLVGAAIIAVHMHNKVRLEELHLEKVHGAAFRDYRARTRRYL